MRYRIPVAMLVLFVIAVAYAGSLARAENRISGYEHQVMVAWDAAAGIAPTATTSFATLDVRAGTNVGWHVLDFDDTVNDEQVLFRGTMPPSWDGGAFTCTVTFGMTSATAGDVVIGIAVMGGTTDLDADSLDTAIEQTVTVPGTCGVFQEETFALTSATADGLAAGDRFALKVYRSGSDAADTAAGDMEVLCVSFSD